MIVALIALAVALGGTSFAAVRLSKNSVRSIHIKNGQVKNRDLGPNAVDASKVADGSLSRSDLASGVIPDPPDLSGFLRREEVPDPPDLSGFLRREEGDSRYLATNAKASDSEKLDGIGAEGFVQGAGQSYSRSGAFTVFDGSTHEVNVAGFGKVRIQCADVAGTALASADWLNSSGATQEVWWWNRDGVGQQAAANNTSPDLTPMTENPYVVTLQVAKQPEVVTATISVDGGPNCRYAISVLKQS